MVEVREVAVLDRSARVAERTAETPSSLDELHERTHVRLAALTTNWACRAQIDQWGLRLQEEKRINHHGRKFCSLKEDESQKSINCIFIFPRKKETRKLISVNYRPK